jgi:uncharacterized protein (DUF2147 family)
MLVIFWLSVALAQIEGYWLTEDKSGVIQIYKNGQSFEGKIVGGEKKGDGLDNKNPDPSLRSRELIGMVILKDLKLEGEEYKQGEIYDPNSGNTYRLKARLIDSERLKLRGYIGVSLFGRNEIWTKQNK